MSTSRGKSLKVGVFGWRGWSSHYGKPLLSFHDINFLPCVCGYFQSHQCTKQFGSQRKAQSCCFSFWVQGKETCWCPKTSLWHPQFINICFFSHQLYSTGSLHAVSFLPMLLLIGHKSQITLWYITCSIVMQCHITELCDKIFIGYKKWTCCAWDKFKAMNIHKAMWSQRTISLFDVLLSTSPRSYLLILADGKLILLCDRRNPINPVCPIFTSPPSHTPRFPWMFWPQDPLLQKSRRRNAGI